MGKSSARLLVSMTCLDQLRHKASWLSVDWVASPICRIRYFTSVFAGVPDVLLVLFARSVDRRAMDALCVGRKSNLHAVVLFGVKIDGLCCSFRESGW